MYRVLSLAVVILALISASAEDLNADVYSHDRVVVCYMASWATYRPSKGSYNWQNIDPAQCTHIIYSFAGLDNSTFTIKSLDPFLDLPEDGGKSQYQKVQSLKDRHPKLKVILAVGGWNEGSEKYSTMAMNPDVRRNFVETTVAFIRKHSFDGFDLDWEYPGSRMGRIEDKENYVSLLKELREALDKHKLLLTVAVGAAPSTAKIGYNIPEISKYVHYINLMCYDYHGSWESQTGHNAPLYLPDGILLDEDHRFSVNDTVHFYVKNGAPREKLVLGMPFYGRTFNLLDANLNHVGALTIGPGFQGEYTRENGFLGYNEICKELGNGTWVQSWDETAGAPYMYSDDKWVSFDNDRSIALKARYALTQGLAGAMVWAVDNDDFQGECTSMRYPLLRTINSVFKQGAQDKPEEVTTEKPSVGAAVHLSCSYLLLAAAAVTALLRH